MVYQLQTWAYYLSYMSYLRMPFILSYSFADHAKRNVHIKTEVVLFVNQFTIAGTPCFNKPTQI